MCWAFGMASLLETSLLSQGLGTYDLSEEHLAYFLQTGITILLEILPVILITIMEQMTMEIRIIMNPEMTCSHHFFLSTWSGMTTEEDVPMATDETHTKKTGVIPDASKGIRCGGISEECIFFRLFSKCNEKMVLANNAVTLMYNAQNRYYNADTAAYSYPSSTKSINHLVTVVGWDDNYSAKKNF